MAQLSRTGAVIGYLTAVGALVGMTGGCGTGGGGFGSSAALNSNPLLGTWTRASLSVDGATVTCPNNLVENSVTVDTCVAGETIQFTSSGTYTMTYPKARFGHLVAENGTYTRSGSTLTLIQTSTTTDTLDTGSLTNGTVKNVVPTQVVPNTITIAGNDSSFTLTPQAPTTNSGYVVPESLDGNVVTDTYTLNAS